MACSPGRHPHACTETHRAERTRDKEDTATERKSTAKNTLTIKTQGRQPGPAAALCQPMQSFVRDSKQRCVIWWTLSPLWFLSFFERGRRRGQSEGSRANSHGPLSPGTNARAQAHTKRGIDRQTESRPTRTGRRGGGREEE